MNDKKIIPVFDISRNCNGCTACCDGWLLGSAHGHEFFPGRPCHYVSENGCGIYEQRPENPCKGFMCGWLAAPTLFPDWLKPSLSGVIIQTRVVNEIPYLYFSETGKKMDANVLNWIFQSYLNGAFANFVYILNGGVNIVGQLEFIKAFKEQEQNSTKSLT